MDVGTAQCCTTSTMTNKGYQKDTLHQCMFPDIAQDTAGSGRFGGSSAASRQSSLYPCPLQSSFFPSDAKSPYEVPQKKRLCSRAQKYHSLALSLQECFKFSSEMWNCSEPQEAEQWWMVKRTIRRVRAQFPSQMQCLPLSNI